MTSIRDSLKMFKSAFKSGRSEPGSWDDLERFGRFEGTGEVTADLTLPGGLVAISAEDYLDVGELECELRGPGGEAVELKHHSSHVRREGSHALRNLDRIASGKVSAAGLHHLRVKAPNSGEALLIVVGEELTAAGSLKDMASEMVPGGKLVKRLRGG